MTLQRRGIGVRTRADKRVKYQIFFISKGAVQVYYQEALKEKKRPNPIDDKPLGSAMEENFPRDIYLGPGQKWAFSAELGSATSSS